jgi:hypothetical protein
MWKKTNKSDPITNRKQQKTYIDFDQQPSLGTTRLGKRAIGIDS